MRFKYAQYDTLICPNFVKELNEVRMTNQNIEIGANVTLARLNDELHNFAEKYLNTNDLKHKQRAIRAIIEQIHWFSGTAIRFFDSFQ